MNNISWGIFSFFAGELVSVALYFFIKNEKLRNWFLVFGTILSGIVAFNVQKNVSATPIETNSISVASPTPPLIPTRTEKPSIVETIDADGVPMMFVQEGEFVMGSDNGREDEQPVHTVYLDAYYIDKYEITNAIYKTCVDAGACKDTLTYSPENTNYLVDVTYRDYPVIAVDWNSAWIFCNWRGARLPTEAEWEKAARGTDGRIYPWGNNINNARANYGLNVGDYTPVGKYESGVSVYGVYDMAGNVWEWVNSQYKDYPYDSSDGRENYNPSGIHILRGGDYSEPDDFVRTTYRFPLAPPDVIIRTGFRCAKDANP